MDDELKGRLGSMLGKLTEQITQDKLAHEEGTECRLHLDKIDGFIRQAIAVLNGKRDL